MDYQDFTLSRCIKDEKWDFKIHKKYIFFPSICMIYLGIWSMNLSLNYLIVDAKYYFHIDISWFHNNNKA
jgi:hypothetical protein